MSASAGKTGRSERGQRTSQFDPEASLDWPEHQWPVSAKNGRSMEPLPMAAYASESGHSDNAPKTADLDPEPSCPAPTLAIEVPGSIRSALLLANCRRRA